MKSRQKFTVSEKNITKKFESEVEAALDNRVKKKISNNPLIQKNLSFLQTYNNLFRKPVAHFGDAETYFKKSLRSYEAFDLIRDLNLQNHIVKSVKSFGSLNKRKPRSKQTLLSPKEVPKRYSHSDLRRANAVAKKEQFLVKELFSLEQKPESGSDAESEDKEFLSNTNELLVDLEEVDEVTDESPTTQLEDNLNEKLDHILKTESTDMAEDLGGLTDEELEEDIAEAEAEAEAETEAETEAEMGEEDEEMQEVGRMIEEANEELQQVEEEQQQLMETLEEEPTGGDGGDGSTFKFNPAIDAAVLKELEDAERQAKETARVINELKNEVTELLKKEKMTEAEARDLEQKNKELKAQMLLFEEKTKRIQDLLAQSNLFEQMMPIRPTLQMKNKEDMLPKVIVCGLTENNMPKLIVCDGKKKCRPKSSKPPPQPQSQPPADTMAALPQFAKKLNECYCMQEKLAAENADLEGKRYELQSDLLNKDQTVECLQRQLTNIQTEMRMVCKENALLNEKLQCCQVPTCDHSPSSPTEPFLVSSPKKKMACGKGKGICPADIEARLEEYSQNTQLLERQLGDMEAEVRGMQQELTAVQKEREHLEHHRRQLCGRPPCAPPPCFPPPCPPYPCMPPPCPPNPCAPPPCPPSPCECGKGSAEQKLRELKEQYCRLQDDFKGKLTEVAGLRTDNEKLKDFTKAAEDAKKAAEEKLKELENEIKKLKDQIKESKGGATKEQLIEQEQQLAVAKQRFREAQDELEELRALVEDQQGQLDDYRNKYLEAQQQVEEQRRSIDMMEMENQRISEQVNLEIQRVKNQFQEKLQELMPLPDILKSTQMKLQEAQQMHLLAERNNEAIARELQMYKDKIAAMMSQMDEVRSDQQLGADEKATLTSRIEELEQQLAELQEANDKLREDMEKLQEKSDEFETLAEERLHEITQLESQLESLREETARQVARTKDRCEIVRRSMQNQISDLERQLAQSRAISKTAQKDRDDIRQKMQAQINNLNENFEDAQMRIRNLQGHVNFLKNSYGNVYPSSEDRAPKELPDPCNCGADY